MTLPGTMNVTRDAKACWTGGAAHRSPYWNSSEFVTRCLFMFCTCFVFLCIYLQENYKKIVDTICYHAHVQPFSGTALHCPRLHCVAVETNVDASHADIEIMIVEPPRHGGIIRSHSVDRHRFTMADVDDGSVTYEHAAAAAAAAAGNRSDDDDFRFVVRVGAVESTGSVQVRVTDVVTSSSSTTSPAPPSLPRVVANVVATVDEMDAVALSAHLLEVTARDSSSRA